MQEIIAEPLEYLSPLHAPCGMLSSHKGEWLWMITSTASGKTVVAQFIGLPCLINQATTFSGRSEHPLRPCLLSFLATFYGDMYTRAGNLPI